MKVVIHSNPVLALMKEADDKALSIVADVLQYRAPNSPVDKVLWTSMFSWKNKTFPAGFIRPVCIRLKKEGYDVTLFQKPSPAPLGPEKTKDCIVDSLGFHPNYEYQPDAVDKLVDWKAMTARLSTGCHAKGQKILMYDGSVKSVEDVQVGEEIMGPDSYPRKVLTLARGKEQMYKITPIRGNPSFIVNESHVLSLKKSGVGSGAEIVNISVKDYIDQHKSFKHTRKLYTPENPIVFGSNDSLTSPIDPWTLGVIIGDGYIRETGNCTITNSDQEIIKKLKLQAEKLHGELGTKWHPEKNTYTLTLKKSSKAKTNPIYDEIRRLGLCGCRSGEKFIPAEYKLSSVEDRLELLAGLIDTDGFLQRNGYEYTTKSSQLAKDVAFVARSLGLRVCISDKALNAGPYKGNVYKRLNISGSTDMIPCVVKRKIASKRLQKKSANVSGFEIEALGVDNYYGFHLSGDHLYLSDDFLVHHNSGKSRVAKLAYKRIGRKALFLTTRKILAYQMKESVEKTMGETVGVIGDSKFQTENKFTVATVATLAPVIKKFNVENEAQLEHEAIVSKNARKKKAEWARLKKQHGAIEALPKIKEYEKKLAESVPSFEDLVKKAKVKKVKHDKKRDKALKFLKEVEFLIAEEAHESSGDGYFSICQSCVNAHYRLGLTATPGMSENDEANMRLYASCGPIGIEVLEKQLIELGNLSTPKFQFLNYKKPRNVTKRMGWPEAYEKGIVLNQERNNLIVDIGCESVSDYGLSTLLLVLRTKHGDLLRQMFKDRGLIVPFIGGSASDSERRDALEYMERGNAIIASTILDVGVDVPSLFHLMKCGGGKAESADRQRTGRVLRRSDPNISLITDFNDHYNTVLAKHSAARMSIVRSTPGFAENMLPLGERFDMSNFKNG